MNRRTVTITAEVVLDVADTVGDELLHRYLTKAVDGGLDSGFPEEEAVVRETQIDIQL